MVYPAPDRSNFTPNHEKTAENDALDIGWNEGVLTDGRPYRVECWAADQVTSLTFFFSALDLEELGDADLAAMLEREGLIFFASDKRFVAGRKFIDPSGNEMWSVNVVIGDEEDIFLDGSRGVELRPHTRPG